MQPAAAFSSLRLQLQITDANVPVFDRREQPAEKGHLHDSEAKHQPEPA